MHEPILGKADPHGFDYTPIKWSDFQKLKRAAQTAADNIGYPVYLVGSALYKDPPRDIDVSVIVPYGDYLARFGPLPNTQDGWALYLAMVHNNTFDEIAALHFCLMGTHHLDIKVCPDIWWPNKEKWLLASPRNVFERQADKFNVK